ncbi:MAG: redoxin domain-containing protein [Acidobacteriota bacterium]
MRTATVILILFFVFVSAASGQKAPIGSPIENFTLQDVDGKARSLTDLMGANGAVMIFLSTQCPVVRGYNERIAKIAADYKSKGINFVGIYSNSTEPLEMVRKHAAEHYTFPVLIDKGNRLADRLGANVTPEVYYVDAKSVLLYHGAIDNDRSGKNPTEQYLQTAFDASLSGKRIERTSANAFGCSIRRVGE